MNCDGESGVCHQYYFEKMKRRRQRLMNCCTSFANILWDVWGIPYRDRGVSIISVVLDAPGDVTSALSGKLGMQEGVSAKTLTAKL